MTRRPLRDPICRMWLDFGLVMLALVLLIIAAARWGVLR